jgi:predicted dehydrogenase
VYEGIGIGFIGCGDITRRLSRLLRRDHRKVPQYFASRSAAKASDFAHELGGAGHHGSYEAALSDSRIRAVWIATPPDLHLGLTLQALARGKDVIVEKPAFASLAEFDTVHAAARRRGRVLIAETYPYKPSTERLKKLMAAGSVGEVRATHINAQKHKDVHHDEWRSQHGALFEEGIHWFALLASLGPRAHDVDNLYVVDASFFPSSAAVNPVPTIVAQALRVADHLQGSMRVRAVSG